MESRSIDSNAAPRELDAIVIGAGQAGLAAAYHLRQVGLQYVVLERGAVGETWRSQRWDSFSVNTPNWANVLPGDAYTGPDRDAFYTRDELVQSFERYVERMQLPVRTHVTVVAVEPTDRGFAVSVADQENEQETLAARAVVVASGILQRPRIPSLTEQVPDGTTQLHAAQYRSPSRLPAGAVVVVGGGQSGCQITEDLLAGGRRVYLCTSKVGRIPRRYRGRDILAWWADMGVFEVTPEELEDPAVQFAAQPQVSGVGLRGRTVSYQQLQRDGAVLMGRLTDVRDGTLVTDDGLRDYVQFADAKSAEFKRGIDEYIADHGIGAPDPEEDHADVAAGESVWRAGLTELDLAEAGVGSVVWCTGFVGDFDWIRLPVVDDDGRPIHEGGISRVPGLYFVGFPWLRVRKSGLIYGVDDDARRVAEHLSTHLTEAP